MTYLIRQEEGSLLILAVADGRERLVAICGNPEDAGAVAAGLRLIDALKPPADPYDDLGNRV